MQIKLQTHHCPRLTTWHVRRALKWMPSADLTGLEFIRLMDEEPDDPEAQKTPAYLRGFLYNGRYLKKSTDDPSHIVLYTRDLYFGIPSLFKPTPVATLRIASTLAHEVGHHVIATRGYIYDSHEKYKPWRSGTFDPYEEKMAEAYAEHMLRRMCQSWSYKLGRLLARMISGIFLEVGVGEHWNGNYDRAAYWNFQAFMLNPENVEAGYAYRQDIEMLRPNVRRNSPAPTTSAHHPIDRIRLDACSSRCCGDTRPSQSIEQ